MEYNLRWETYQSENSTMFVAKGLYSRYIYQIEQKGNQWWLKNYYATAFFEWTFSTLIKCIEYAEELELRTKRRNNIMEFSLRWQHQPPTLEEKACLFANSLVSKWKYTIEANRPDRWTLIEQLGHESCAWYLNSLTECLIQAEEQEQKRT